MIKKIFNVSMIVILISSMMMTSFATDTELNLDMEIKVTDELLSGVWESVATVSTIGEFDVNLASHESMIEKYVDRGAINSVTFVAGQSAKFLLFNKFTKEYDWDGAYMNLWGLHQCKMTIEAIDGDYYMFMENKDGSYAATGNHNYYVFLKTAETIKTDEISAPTLPSTISLHDSYEISEKAAEFSDMLDVSSWARPSIQELKYQSLLIEQAFENYSDGITRERFVYLMVTLYETLTSEKITIDPEISFIDSTDKFVLKAATIGITSGIGDNKFGPENVINREQLATFIIKTLQLANVELIQADGVDVFADDDQISGWAKSSTYIAKGNAIISGIGNNKYDPKSEATNEQALAVTHKLLKSFGDLKWGETIESDRVYLNLNDELYQISFADDVILLEENGRNQVFFRSYKDMNTFLLSSRVTTSNLDFTAIDNPSVKGMLNLEEEEIVKISIKNIYYGVDITGEELSVDIDNGLYTAKINNNLTTNSYSYKGYQTVKYYDTDGIPFIVKTLPTDAITTLMGNEYEVTFNAAWNIYIIDFNSIEK